MTDRYKFSDVRTARASANGEKYTVSLDRFAVDVDQLRNVWWLNKPADDQHVPTQMIARGVLLTRYDVRRDSDPSWFAQVEIGAPDVLGGRLRVVSVTVAADSLSSTALPLTPIVEACVRVGGVVGLFRDVVGERSGLTIRTFQAGAPLRDDEGKLVSHDEVLELTGEKPRNPRGYRTTDAMLLDVWNAMCNYERSKAEIRAAKIFVPKDLRESKRKYVSRVCNLPASNVGKQMTAATNKYGSDKPNDTNNTKQNRGKK